MDGPKGGGKGGCEGEKTNHLTIKGTASWIASVLGIEGKKLTGKCFEF